MPLSNRSSVKLRTGLPRKQCIWRRKRNLAAETGDWLGVRRPAQRPNFPRYCKPALPRSGNPDLFPEERKTTKSARMDGGARSLTKPVSVSQYLVTGENIGVDNVFHSTRRSSAALGLEKVGGCDAGADFFG